MKDHLILVRHILAAIEGAEQYTRGLSRKDFLKNFMVQDAVILNLEIAGEACRGIPNDLKNKFAEVPWK